MFLVLLEPVNRADSKYVFAYWIESQIREIYKETLTIAHMALEWSIFGAGLPLWILTWVQKKISKRSKKGPNFLAQK